MTFGLRRWNNNTLQKAATQGKQISKALATESALRAKRYSWIAALSSPIVGIVVPLVLKWPPGCRSVGMDEAARSTPASRNACGAGDWLTNLT
jgi:hypothetical protein